ncbi:MAG: LPS export ABC transporter permease LptG [Gammaproteobacteria bacterium CG22_combo_CG10-13_8_21_14_all_40_8]|nr:MAG: LPS export ABC transporter permease LptG [Gammaproteobacteria bacterium CG22_combo_CG10-13_8_21_14_all_40_8]
MKIIYRYISSTVIKSIILSLLFLTVLRLVFLLLDDLPNIGRGSYNFLDALIHLVLNTPNFLSQYFPMAALIGTITGLGLLATSSELLVIRASGVSIKSILGAVMVAVLPLVIVIFLLGEFVSPISIQFAQQQRSLAISGGQVIRSKSGVWARDDNDFIHIGRANPNGKIENIEHFRFESTFKLTAILKAEKGEYLGKGQWKLYQVKLSHFSATELSSENLDDYLWQSQLTPENIGVVGASPDGLGLIELWTFANYLDLNKLDSRSYRLAFWRSILQPLVIIVMLMIGASFVFGSVRQVAIGTRIMVGVLFGLAFYVINEVLGNMAVVYQFTPFWGAMLPLVVFSLTAAYRLKKIR